MTQPPRSALILGVAGLLPFLWSVATEMSPALAEFGLRWMGPRFLGPYVGLAYGTVILSFMAGALWGFASRAEVNAGLFHALAVIPALWAFFFVGGGPVSAAIYLAAGFAGLLALDWFFDQHGLTPSWWMPLRVGLTAVVVACLMFTAFA